MTRSIAVTFDYRCPFAYNGNAATIAAVRAGVDLDVRYMAFSLDQVHVPEGEPPVWERPDGEWGSGVLSLLYGIAVRDQFPEQFPDAHLALFAARHEHGLKLGHVDVLRDAVASAGSTPTPSRRRSRPAVHSRRSRPSTPKRSTGTRSSACRRTSRATRRCSSVSWSAGASTISSACWSCSSGTASTSSSAPRSPADHPPALALRGRPLRRLRRRAAWSGERPEGRRRVSRRRASATRKLGPRLAVGRTGDLARGRSALRGRG